MDPLTTTAVAQVVGPIAQGYAIEKLLDQLGGTVFGHWSRYRASRFAEAFISAIADSDQDVATKKIDDFANDPKKSAALFDAYRRVVLAASPVLGPRIIALVMAKVVIEERPPTQSEEQILSAARELNDAELISARDDWELRRNKVGPKNRQYPIYHPGQPIEFYESRGGGDEGHNYWFDQGPWAGKLSTLGFLWTTPRVKFNHRNEPVIETDLYWSATWEEFATYISVAENLGPFPSSESLST